MEIVYKKINELKPYENNSRTHDESQIKQICESIKEYGWTNPVLIDEKGMIIAGHGRVEAGKKLDIKEVPCIVLSGLTEAQKKAYVIADNKMALNAGWNEELLKTELEKLKELDFDLELTGFNIDELDELMEFCLNADDYGTDFQLPDSDKSEMEQITFTVHKEQAELIRDTIKKVQLTVDEYKGNTNKNGNAIWEVCREWEEQKK